MRLSRILPAVAVTCAALLLTATHPARADCPVPPLAGHWQSDEPVDNQELVGLEILHRCSPGKAGRSVAAAGHEWQVRAFARCRPRDCVWGRAPGEMAPTGDLHVAYTTFSAYRTLRIFGVGDALTVDIAIDYHSASRPGFVATRTFVRAD